MTDTDHHSFDFQPANTQNGSESSMSIASSTPSSSQDLPIHLNIGGHAFITRVRTLTRRDPHSALAQLAQCKATSGSDTPIFIDRDGTHFRYILNYLRDGSLLLPHDPILLTELQTEAQHYKLETLVTILRDKISKLGGISPPIPSIPSISPPATPHPVIDVEDMSSSTPSLSRPSISINLAQQTAAAAARARARVRLRGKRAVEHDIHDENRYINDIEDVIPNIRNKRMSQASIPDLSSSSATSPHSLTRCLFARSDPSTVAAVCNTTSTCYCRDLLMSLDSSQPPPTPAIDCCVQQQHRMSRITPSPTPDIRTHRSSQILSPSHIRHSSQASEMFLRSHMDHKPENGIKQPPSPPSSQASIDPASTTVQGSLSLSRASHIRRSSQSYPYSGRYSSQSFRPTTPYQPSSASTPYPPQSSTPYQQILPSFNETYQPATPSPQPTYSEIQQQNVIAARIKGAQLGGLDPPREFRHSDPSKNIYSWDEISRHTSSHDCWLVVKGHVYEVTSFLPQHPAGPTSIVKNAGTDATRHFDFHTKEAQKLWKQYEIGRVQGYHVEKGCCTQ